MSAGTSLGAGDESLEALVDFAARVADSGPPGEVRTHLEMLLADSLGCAIAGSGAPAARQAAALAAALTQPGGPCRVIGAAAPVSPETAALVNGAAVRALELNDTYLGQEPVHPSDVTAALLALAQWRGRSGSDLVAALTTAYEVLAFLCDSVHIRERGWDTVTLGGLAIAIAGAPLIGLNAASALEAARLAAITAPALVQTRIGALCAFKNLSFAVAGRTAVFLLAAAEAGVTGPPQALTGSGGLGPVVLGPLEPTTPGIPWRCLRARIKMHASQYFTQPAIDAALLARAQLDGAVDDARRISVRTFGVAVRTAADGPEKWAPTSAETADHSLPYCIAAALLDGRITPEQFGSERRGDPRLRRLLERIEVDEEPGFTEVYPWRTPTAIAIELADGSIVEGRVDDARGELQAPGGSADAACKLEAVLGFAFGGDAGRVRAATDAVNAFARADDLDEALADLHTVVAGVAHG